MFIKVQLIGTGTQDDPYRAPLPTYTLRHVDYVNKVCVVEVPEVDITDSMVVDTGLATETYTFGEVVVKLSPQAIDDWYAYLDARYVEHSGKFRPQLAPTVASPTPPPVT